jgi:hypothetical protein
MAAGVVLLLVAGGCADTTLKLDKLQIAPQVEAKVQAAKAEDAENRTNQWLRHGQNCPCRSHF